MRIGIDKHFYICFSIHCLMAACEMKGFLSFLVLWLVSREKMSGAEIALELKKRKLFTFFFRASSSIFRVPVTATSIVFKGYF